MALATVPVTVRNFPEELPVVVHPVSAFAVCLQVDAEKLLSTMVRISKTVAILQRTIPSGHVELRLTNVQAAFAKFDSTFTISSWPNPKAPITNAKTTNSSFREGRILYP